MYRESIDWRIRWKQMLILGFVAFVCAIPRFGQRENPLMPISDSDVYIQMANSYASGGSLPEERIAAIWHYNRPLLSCFGAGIVTVIPGVSVEQAMSVVSVFSAWLVSVLIVMGCQAGRFCQGKAVIAGILFLVGFPQLNWGYHLLTDSLGYAMAATVFAVFLYAFSMMQSKRIVAAGFFGLLAVALQVVAFYARETAWMAPVAAFVITAIVAVKCRKLLFWMWMLVGLLVLAKLPHSYYTARHGLISAPLHYNPDELFNLRYICDAIIKSGVAFHLAWPVAVFGFYSGGRWRRVPDWLIGWTAAGLLYAGAGFLHNTLAQGYPLRMTYVLAPVVYAGCLCAVDRFAKVRVQTLVAIGLVFCYAAVSFVGLYLDPGTPRVRVIDYMH